jgi:predicted nuclease of predicted toxin-antitoxin system
MRFLCDMGISRRVTEWLRRQGYESSHLGEEGLARLPNGQIFSKAISENRVILTCDLDFGEIAAMAKCPITSVVVFRLQNTRADHIIERLSVVLEKIGSELKHGAIVTVEETRFRIRKLPL